MTGIVVLGVAAALLAVEPTPGPVPGSVEWLVVWQDQADLHDLAQRGGTARGLAAWERLAQAQARVRAQRVLPFGVEVVRDYTVVNASLLRGTVPDLKRLQGRPDIAALVPNTPGRIDLPVTERSSVQKAIESSLTQIRVPEVWALGVRGAGITVASADTGVQWNHPALIGRYRGNGTGGVSHGYHWHDAIHATGSSCGASAAAPCDDNSHGSHTVGTMLGDDGQGNQIGVAPLAQWIGCRNMNAGVGTPATYLECMDFFLAPTDAQGANPDPALAPHLINNSWGCPPEEGCTPQQSALLEAAVDNLRAAGILFVAAAGNSGSSCSSIVDPPAWFASSLTVGNSRADGTMNSSSSRGPVTVDGSNRLKPDLSAPGTGIRSSLHNGGYGSKTGTSMAAPHIAGVAALVMSANPWYQRRPEAVETLLRQSTVPLTLTQTCGGIAPSVYPNPIAGHGRIDALVAVQAALNGLLVDGFE